MNTRQAIQPLDVPAVLSIRFTPSSNRFIAGLTDGIRLFRSDNCLNTYQPALPIDGGVGLVDAWDDRYLVYVGGGKAPTSSPNVVIFWDAFHGKEVTRFDLHEPIQGLRLTTSWLAVVLRDRVVLFAHQDIDPQALPSPPPEADEAQPDVFKGPNIAKAVYTTSQNQYAVAHLRDDLLVLPSQAVGQVQLIPLPSGSKRVLRVSSSAVRCLTTSTDGTLLATASEQGTLIRVFDIKTHDQVAEFRRGMDHAIILGLSFSGTNRWLACTSDKGTLHIYDLRPTDPSTVKQSERGGQGQSQSRKPPHHPRLASLDKDTFSTISGRSTPASAITTGYQGSIQEYYGLRPPPASASQSGQQAAVSAIAALKASPFAPRILKDVRSVASAAFYMGEDSPYWQGGPSHSWTTTPNGTRKRVRNPVPMRAGDPTGRPPKGVVLFAARQSEKLAEDESQVLYVVGGGSDARWEKFELLPADDGIGWGLVNRGFRRYLTKQFAD